ncbi:TIGR02594 family protein [Klebsiella pneumoniae]|uniref:TIGR02594 family protein n=1 Tax=Klebsiella pneumoniae TaxID=573 RepID=UPI001CBC8BCC|nr:TIGR02594 family protein [Klebsiella pneumoniae]EKX7637457.1 TIGR02594 family protein [Klebsiella pneumoniae]ELA1308044.1 TIGR02594 family protein [Klebsiella pneumoniae]MBZ1696853.1 TIGR02594 family protein [Klebsiella pneumoniae]HDZ2531263.1 TIGR02594 family protein [Klebsiella pneumoniae]HDZ2539735.1 TIGR02594 family protein [Klebsiella pneumoniae]
MSEPKWLTEARHYIGEREIKGPKHNPLILQMWKDIKRGGIKDDETPWCAAFVGSVLERVQITSTRFESAKSYLTWGTELKEPANGCIVVFTRSGGGHVGFVVGRTASGDLMVLGGNQSDAVNIRAFPRSRVSGYRWPAGVPDKPQPLPLMDGERSTSEA